VNFHPDPTLDDDILAVAFSGEQQIVFVAAASGALDHEPIQAIRTFDPDVIVVAVNEHQVVSHHDPEEAQKVMHDLFTQGLALATDIFDA
jgi:hypothetical protein